MTVVLPQEIIARSSRKRLSQGAPAQDDTRAAGSADSRMRLVLRRRGSLR